MATVSTRTRARTRSSARNEDTETPRLEQNNAVKSRKKQSRKRKAQKNEEKELMQVSLPETDQVQLKLTEETPKQLSQQQEVVSEEGKHNINQNNVSEVNDEDNSKKNERDSETHSQKQTGSKRKNSISKASESVSQIYENEKVTDNLPDEKGDTIKKDKSDTAPADEPGDEQHERRRRNRKRRSDDDEVIDFSTVDKEELAKAMYAINKSESFKNSKPKGQPKSGRTWKTEHTSRFSEMKKVRPLKTSWGRKMAAKAEKKSIKMYEKQLQESRAIDVQKRKDKKREKMERKRENEKQSEVVQVIKDTAKIKRMKKKQLYQLQKR